MPDLDGFTDDFYLTFNKEFMSVLHKHFQKLEEGKILPKSFYKTGISLIPKPHDGMSRKEIYPPMSLINEKIPKKKKKKGTSNQKDIPCPNEIYPWNGRLV